MLGRLPGAGGGHRKKLEEAVEHWADGRFTDEQEHAANQEAVDEDAAVFGLLVVRPAQPAPDEFFYLWPENVPAWQLWHCLQTQWRISMDGREGLDYAGVEAELRNGPMRVRRKDLRRRWDEIKVMERTALRVWREQRARKG